MKAGTAAAAAAGVSPGEAILDDLESRLAARIGELIQFWGFGPHAGRVWTVLYLSVKPLAASDIAARLRMSAGSVSQTLNLLGRWGVIQRFRAPGRRLLLHTDNDDVWTGVARVLGERELGLVRTTSGLLAGLVADVGRARAAGASEERVAHVERRLRSLLRLTRAAEAMLEALLAAATLDLGRLRALMRLARGGRS